MATDSTIPRIDGAPHFTADAWDHVIRAADRINSREAVVWMSPDVFLALAERGEDPEKTRRLAHVTVFNAMPYLAGDFDRETGVMRMTSHEGRHRARRLKTLGVTQFPVRLEARRVRWADTTDRPITYIGEEGDVIPGSAVHFLAPTKVEPARCVAHGAARCGCTAAARCPAGTYSEYRGHKILHSDGMFYVMPYRAENASEAAARRWIDSHVEHTITWMGKHKIAPTESDVAAITEVAACYASNRDEGLLDYMKAARGRTAPLGGDISLAWQMMTRNVYSDGDLVAVVVRECIQNSGDAVRRAYRKKAGQWQIEKDTGYIKIGIQTTGERRVMERGAERMVKTGTITVEDNGVGMDLFTGSDATFKTGVFFNLGGSDKKDLDDDGKRVAAGGFGAAKAAILGSSLSGSWAVWSRNQVARKMTGQDPDFDVLPEARQGTRMEIYDVDLSNRFSEFIASWGEASARATTIIAGSDVRDMTITLNGNKIAPAFTGRGTRLREYEELDWGDPRTTVEVRSYRRTEMVGGAFWIRLKGMLQFRAAPEKDMPFDVVVDMETQVDPNEASYPFPVSRSMFRGDAQEAFRHMRSRLAQETAAASKGNGFTILGPDATDPREIKATEKVTALLADALGDMHDTLMGVAEITREFYKNDSRVDSSLSQWWGGTETSNAPGVDVTTPEMTKSSILKMAEGSGTYISHREKTAIQDVLDGYESGVDEVMIVLERISENVPTDQRATISATISVIVDKMAENLPKEAAKVFRKKASLVNPFGKHATIFRSDTACTDEEYKTFVKDAKRHMKALAVWDFTCRLIAREGRMRINFGTGFVLEQGTRGLNAPVPGDRNPRVVLINPFYIDAVLNTHLPAKNALAIASYFRDIGCHEVAHLTDSDHDDRWSISRENLAVNTAHTLPVIEDVVRRIYKLGKRRAYNPGAAGKNDKVAETLRQELKAYEEKVRGYEMDNDTLFKEKNELRSKYQHATMDRDIARKALDAAKGTMSRLLPRLSAVTAYGEYREWLRGAGSAILGGLSVDEFLASLDGDPKLVADFLLGEGAQKIADAFTDPDKVARGAEARMVVASEWGDVVPLDPAYDPYARSCAGLLFGDAGT